MKVSEGTVKVRYDSDILRENQDGKLLQFVNAKVLKQGKFVDDHIWVLDGKIISSQEVFFRFKSTADIQIDCCGKVLSPGFIDIQLNGGFGVDFSTFEGTSEDYERGVGLVCKELLSHGVTAFLPTLITSTPETYKKVLPLLYRRDGGPNGASILGVHAEGPFISEHKRGCHPPECVRPSLGDDPKKTILDVYGSIKNISIVTIAPELPGSQRAIEWLSHKGVTVSMGHSEAGWGDGVRGVEAGAKCITHLFNAMQTYHHRDPGLIGLLTTTTKNAPLYYGIISDGIHAHESALRIAHRTCPEGLILVTDAMAALGMGDGVHRLGKQTINVRGYLATLDGTKITAGSVASMPYCVRYFVQAARATLQEALTAATERPAALLGIESKKGVLCEGADADIVILDDNARVQSTFVGGRLVYKIRS